MPRVKSLSLNSQGGPHFKILRANAQVGIGIALSGDDGATWTETDPLYVSPADSRDCAYPSTILDGNDHVLAAYYTAFVDGNSHIELARLRVDASPGAFRNKEGPLPALVGRIDYSDQRQEISTGKG